MHTLQPKHIKLKSDEVRKLIKDFNIDVSQLPKVKSTDPCAPENSQTGDVLKIDRVNEDKIRPYYRVVV